LYDRNSVERIKRLVQNVRFIVCFRSSLLLAATGFVLTCALSGTGITWSRSSERQQRKIPDLLLYKKRKRMQDIHID
jgi:hypothetical protein